MREKWNNRYKEEGFAYGSEPNIFFKEWLSNFKTGSILMPADGEGRNGVFAAKKGWDVKSFDLSIEGKNKALKLAEENCVELEYIVGDLDRLSFNAKSFDLIGLIYAHFAAEKKSIFHKKLDNYLRPGASVIFEAFSKKHLDYSHVNPKVGGPKDPDSLFSKEEIISDFANYKIIYLEEEVICLNEGKYHIGEGSVIRFIGEKI